MTKRPLGIVIVAIIMFFASLTALIVGISLLLSGTALDVLWTLNPAATGLTSMGTILGIFLLFICIITLFTGIGLLKGLKWAWRIIVIIFILNGIGDVFRVALGGIEGLIGILIAAVFLFYLTRPEVKKFFEKSN
jgi:hypothetical protein